MTLDGFDHEKTARIVAVNWTALAEDEGLDITVIEIDITSDEQVEAYIAEHGVLVNPLVYDGYPSIGCAPCTRRVAPGEDVRSGRWAGTNKTECGIHM